MFGFEILTFGCRDNITDEQVEHFLHKITCICFCRERTALNIVSELTLREIGIHQMDQCLIHILRLFIEFLIGREVIVTQSLQFGICFRIEHIAVFFFQAFVECLVIFKITFALRHRA